MEKTIIQIQEEVKDVKLELINILRDFYTRNPSVILSGNFGISRDYTTISSGKQVLIRSEIEIDLKITIDEKQNKLYGDS